MWRVRLDYKVQQEMGCGLWWAGWFETAGKRRFAQGKVFYAINRLQNQYDYYY